MEMKDFESLTHSELQFLARYEIGSRKIAQVLSRLREMHYEEEMGMDDYLIILQDNVLAHFNHKFKTSYSLAELAELWLNCVAEETQHFRAFALVSIWYDACRGWDTESSSSMSKKHHLWAKQYPLIHNCDHCGPRRTYCSACTSVDVFAEEDPDRGEGDDVDGFADYGEDIVLRRH